VRFAQSWWIFRFHGLIAGTSGALRGLQKPVPGSLRRTGPRSFDSVRAAHFAQDDGKACTIKNSQALKMTEKTKWKKARANEDARASVGKKGRLPY
jgi:hypothetical protein